jgi:hypothetical protein
MKATATLLFAFLLSLFAPTLVSAQLSPVDAKNGFKDFKLGDLKQKWSANLVLDKTLSGVKMYRYNGPCCQKVFNADVEKILLGFSTTTNKLVSIYILTPRKSYTNLEGYLSYYEDGFKSMFGKPQHTNHEDVQGEPLECWTYTWQGNKASVDLRAYYGPVENGQMYSEVYVFDMNFVRSLSPQKVDSGF